ncbi:MAG TPA: hypothetical protein PLA68_05675 [Panacibacter sp.]|nr:hypothetical protein [Panacibacter sp.]
MQRSYLIYKGSYVPNCIATIRLWLRRTLVHFYFYSAFTKAKNKAKIAMKTLPALAVVGEKD